MDLRPLLFVLGILLAIVAAAMIVPLVVALATPADEESWRGFFIAILAGAFGGGAMVLSNRHPAFEISIRQGFALVTLCWTILPLYAAIPFWLSGYGFGLTDSVFEAVSGLTTTGASVFRELNSLPHSFLVWRAILQWLGGIGVVVMAATLLPFLRIGGMQLFSDAAPESTKGAPRMRSQISAIAEIYLSLTFLCGLCYALSGINLFDAALHAMSTISTGGFSTRDESFGAFVGLQAQIVATVFMLASSLPFLLYMHAVNGDAGCLWRSDQVRWFALFAVIGTLLVAAGLLAETGKGFLEALHIASFTTASFLSGTGFTIGDGGAWGSGTVAVLFFMMFAGGCAGSTTGGIRIFRFQVLAAMISSQMRQLLHPSGVFISRFQGKPLPSRAVTSVLGFFFAYTLVFLFLSLFLSLIGIAPLSALCAAASAVSNSGAGLDLASSDGTETFASFDVPAKWALCAGMIVGRLEVLAVLVLLSPRFWRA